MSSAVVTPLRPPTHDRTKAVRRVRVALGAAERAIEVALQKSAEYAAILPAAGYEANLSTLYGQDALERAIASAAALGVARREMGASHKHIAGVLAEIKMDGDDGDSFGNGGDKPKNAAAPVPD